MIAKGPQNKVGKPGLNQACLAVSLVLAIILVNEMNLSDVCQLPEQILIQKEDGRLHHFVSLQEEKQDPWKGLRGLVSKGTKGKM